METVKALENLFDKKVLHILKLFLAKKEQTFYTLGDVADHLGLSRMTVYRYVKSRKLRAYKFGTHHRVRKNDLKTFISSHKV